MKVPGIAIGLLGRGIGVAMIAKGGLLWLGILMLIGAGVITRTAVTEWQRRQLLRDVTEKTAINMV